MESLLGGHELLASLGVVNLVFAFRVFRIVNLVCYEIDLQNSNTFLKWHFRSPGQKISRNERGMFFLKIDRRILPDIL